MMPRGREQETPLPPSSASPPRQPKGSLSSMVVMRDSAADGGGNSEIENGDARSPERRHDEPPSELQRFSEDSGYGTRTGSLSSSPQKKSKYHRYDPDSEQSGEPQHRCQSPYPRRPEKHRYDPDFDQSVQHGHRFPEPQRTPDHNRYDQGYDQAGRPHVHGPSPRQRFHRHHYDPLFDRLPEHANGSPFQRRLDHHHYDYEYDQPGPEHGREFWGDMGNGRFPDLSPTYGRGRGGRKFRDVSPPYGRGRGGGRFRDVSLPYGLGRGGGRFRDVSPPYVRAGDDRLYDRDLEEHGPGDMQFRGVHQNDPNLAPRSGDWICKNPSCGNLNFARREYCNKCNKFRYGYLDGGPGANPQRSYSGTPSPHGSPRFSGPLHDRGPRRDANSYRSPPGGWARDGPGGPPPPRNGVNFQGPDLQRGKPDYYEEVGFRGRDMFDRTIPNRERYEIVDERRGYDQRPPSPRNRWENALRERSRSPPPRARSSPRKDFGRNRGQGQGNRYRAWKE